jgi:hypothetical protein
MGIDIKKDTCSCSKGEPHCSCTGCKCTITIGGISWILFIIALIFSDSTLLIIALLVAAIVFEESD